MKLEDKKNLLMFCTGSDRVPIKGLAALEFTISRNGPDSDRCVAPLSCAAAVLLPMCPAVPASTCHCCWC